MPLSLRDSLSMRLRTFAPLRTIYRTFLGHEGRERRRKLAAFYGQFLRPNDLVFDIGANIGIYSEVFQSLDCKVVSVEPNPECAAQVEATTRRDRVTVVRAAVGNVPGMCRLFVNELSILSSVSTDWVQKEKETKPSEAATWNKEIMVPVVTIDDLIAKYGMPRYIKLDVEGFEIPALCGMSRQPEYLSFEFHGDTWEKDRICFEKLADDTLFDFVVNEPFRFEVGSWVGRDDVCGRIQAANVETFGDVFGKLAGA
jgi:FkbM family methyltransferase